MIDQAYANTSIYCNARLRNERQKQKKLTRLKTYDAKPKM